MKRNVLGLVICFLVLLKLCNTIYAQTDEKPMMGNDADHSLSSLSTASQTPKGTSAPELDDKNQGPMKIDSAQSDDGQDFSSSSALQDGERNQGLIGGILAGVSLILNAIFGFL